MLNVVSKDEAVKIITESIKTVSPETETVCLADALGRTLSEDIVSSEDIPAFDRSTVDGYAVIASDTFGAGASIPAQLEISGEILMGKRADFALEKGKCVRISTGGMLPENANAAVMVEHTDEDGQFCFAYKSVSPGENVTLRGDDINAGETALKKGTAVSSAQVGILAALGILEVPVFKKPVVAVISTGDEIVSGNPEPGQIRDINSYMLSAALKEYGCDVLSYGALADNREVIADAVKDSVKKADAVIISGGSSAGTRDMTVDIIDSLGRTCFHGIAMKPGKPTIFGTIDGKPVFGLPGHPLVAYFVLRTVFRKYLDYIFGAPEEKPVKKGILQVNIPSNHGREEYLLVRCDEYDNVTPLHTKSGIISLLNQADGFIRVSRNSEGIDKGTPVEIYKL